MDLWDLDYAMQLPILDIVLLLIDLTSVYSGHKWQLLYRFAVSVKASNCKLFFFGLLCFDEMELQLNQHLSAFRSPT